MEKASVVIRGSGLQKLTEILRESFDDYQISRDASIAVLLSDKYYFRINSTLFSTVILDYRDEATCAVSVYSGGGATGLLNVTWGSEGARNREIVEMMEQACRENSWQISIS